MPYLPLLCLAALLSACGDTSSAAVPEVTLQGYIVMPPAAGTATFTASTGSGQTGVVGTATVSADGHYTMQLGQPTATGNTSVLPMLPDAGAQGMAGVKCTGMASPSSTAARFAVLNKGQYLVGTQVTGELVPSVTALAGLKMQEMVVTTKYLAFASQDVRIQGNLNCTFTRLGGGEVAGAVSVQYDLKQGWNTLMIRSTNSRDGTPPFVQTVAESQPLAGVPWRYLPVTP